MPAHDFSTIDTEPRQWMPLPSKSMLADLPPLRDAFGKPIKGRVRLEAPNKHSRLRLVSHVTETMHRVAEIEHGRFVANTSAPHLVRSNHRRTPRPLALAVKRTLDLCLGSLSLMLLSPVFAAIAIAIKMQSDGPIFYASERVGVRGKLFRCYKFRTMVPNADLLRKDLAHLNEREGILFKISNDPRVTPLGAMLRKYSLDELPRLINVLRGEMSLVGPRPSLHTEVMQYETHHFRRLSVIPGMTGLWQVEARSDPSFDSYVALDCKYADNWSVWLDLKILARTLRVVLRGTGV
jgi:lipopolysaccharide/colanic/teichoic acid biosynthesis glycosyltransferase